MASNINIILTAETATAVSALNKAKAATSSLASSVDKANSAASNMSGQYSKTGVALNKFGKGVAQQLGYQVADFAVQVQNGTNAIQAFGQQGSQMLAVFGPVGALLGAGIAIASAFATAMGLSVSSLFGAKEEAKDLDGAIGDLNSALSELSDTYLLSVSESLAEARNAFGDFNESFAETLKFSRDASLEKSYDKIRESVKLAGEAVEKYLNATIDRKKAEGLVQAGADPLSASLKKLTDVMERVSWMSAFTSEEVMALAADFKDLGKEVGDVANQEFAVLIDVLFKAYKKINDFQGSINPAEIRSGFNAATKAIQDQAAALEINNQYHGEAESSINKQRAYAQLAKETVEAQGNLLSGQNQERVKAIELTYELEVEQERLKKIADDSNKAIKDKEALTKKSISDAEAASKRAADLVKAQVKGYNDIIQSIEIQTVTTRAKNDLFGKSNALLEQEVKFQEAVARVMKLKGKITTEEISQIRLKLSELTAEKEILEQQKNAVIWRENSEKQSHKHRTLANDEIKKAQEDINELMSDGMKTTAQAITGLVAKTNTWREALVQVLNKFLEITLQMGKTDTGGFSFASLTKGLGGIFGGLLGGGSAVTPFGSTGNMFPGLMDFHNGGMIGENSGPTGPRSDERMIMARTGERILNRGQSMMSDQGGGGVTVNQTINISTGVQQTVRAEVMSLAPQLAAQAKAAVLDAKKRGGGFGAAFA
jgi:uncharacterized protein YoaH (UPF0181 family)